VNLVNIHNIIRQTIPNINYHRLNGSSSTVLTATPRSYGKGQNSTPYKIKTPERIGMKFGIVYYVLEISPQNKFGDDQISGGFWVNMWNIRCLLLSLLFFQNRPGGHTPKPIFTQNVSNDVDPRTDVPFAVKIETFSNPWPPHPDNHQNLAIFWTGFQLNISSLISKHPLFFIGAP